MNAKMEKAITKDSNIAASVGVDALSSGIPQAKVVSLILSTLESKGYHFTPPKKDALENLSIQESKSVNTKESNFSKSVRSSLSKEKRTNESSFITPKENMSKTDSNFSRSVRSTQVEEKRSRGGSSSRARKDVE